MKVLLVVKATGDNYSIEAGLSDDIRHFDHHGAFGAYPAPCANDKIPVIGGDIVEVTHIDADTFGGLLRMSGLPLPKIDLALLERIDLNGSSIVTDRFDPTYLYAMGVKQLAIALRIPRPSVDGPIDISDKIEEMLVKRQEEIIELGRTAVVASETSYRNCVVMSDGRVGLWSVGENDPLDQSRPYIDGMEVVVVYRRVYKTIDIYCAPTSPYVFGGKEIEGIQFEGHPKACGSPRGVEMGLEDAKRVYKAISASISKTEGVKN
jgi:hypothetical protein